VLAVRKRRVLLGLLWLFGTAAASFIALQGISSVGSRLVGRGPQSMTGAQIDAALNGLPRPVPRTTTGTTLVGRPSSSVGVSTVAPTAATTLATDLATTVADTGAVVTDATGSVLSSGVTRPGGGPVVTTATKPGATPGPTVTTKPGTTPSGGTTATTASPGGGTAHPTTTPAPPTTPPPTTPPPTTQPPPTTTTLPPAPTCSAYKARVGSFGSFRASYCSNNTFGTVSSPGTGYQVVSAGQSTDGSGNPTYTVYFTGPQNYTCTATGAEGPAVSVSCIMTS
jgi:hypothetical protein